MKDEQISPASAEPRIFLLSPVLHCVAMTGLVYLRSSFGYGYLRPKSVFFAFTWAFALYAIYAWMDGQAWMAHRGLLWYGVGAGCLYWIQLGIAVVREWNGGGEHDQYSGTPHLVRMLRLLGKPPTDTFTGRWRLWGQPAIAVGIALVLSANGGESSFAHWLYFVAFCLWLKEILNQWFYLRRRKRQSDIFQDAEAAFAENDGGSSPNGQPPETASRKRRITRPRTQGTANMEEN